MAIQNEKIISIKLQTETEVKGISDLQTRLVKLTAERNKYNKKIRENISLTAQEKTRLGQLQPELVATRNKLRDLERQVVKNNNALKKNSGFVAGVKKGMKQAVTSIGAFAVGFVALGRVVANVFNTIKDFEQGLAELGSITGLQGQALDDLGQAAIRLSGEFGTSAKDILKAFQLVGSASPQLLDNAAALAEVTKQAEILAKAGGLTLPEAAAALTKSMNQFGLSAEEAAMTTDILATSQQKGTATIQQLSESMKNVGSVAKVAGLSFEETNANLQALAKGGLVGAEAGTKLRGVLLRLAKTGKDKFNPATNSMSEILDTLSIEVTDVASAQKLFGAENAAAALTLIEQRKVVEDLNGALNIQGNALEQAKNNTNTLAGSFDKAGTAWDSFVLNTLNGSGFISTSIKSIVDGFTGMFQAFELWNSGEASFWDFDTFDEIAEKIAKRNKRLEEEAAALAKTEEAANAETNAIKKEADAKDKATKATEKLNKELDKEVSNRIKLRQEKEKELLDAESFERQNKKDIQGYVDSAKAASDAAHKKTEDQKSNWDIQLDDSSEYHEETNAQDDAAVEKILENNQKKLDDKVFKLQVGLQAAELAATTLAVINTRSANAEAAEAEALRDGSEAGEIKYQNKLNEIREKEFKNQKKISLALIAIKLAEQIVSIQAAAAANPANAVTAGVAGLTQAAILTGLAIGTSAAQAGLVLSQQYQPTKFADGALLSGASHANGGIPMTINGQGGFEAEGGEAIINKRSTSMFMPLLSAINEAGGGVSFGGGISPSKFAKGGLTPTINKATSMNDVLQAMGSRIDNIKVVNVASDTAAVANRVSNIESDASFG